MKRRNAVHIFRGITIVILSIAVAAVIVMLLWNALIPSIIGWSTINYWQAPGLLTYAAFYSRDSVSLIPQTLSVSTKSILKCTTE